jgi:hypothetical protein
VFILLGQVSEITYELWPEPSLVALAAFHGGMVAVLKLKHVICHRKHTGLSISLRKLYENENVIQKMKKYPLP